MTPLIEKRYNIIEDIVAKHGIEFGDNVFMSIWDLAFNINNSWKSKHFVSVKRFKNWTARHEFSISPGSLFELLRPIRNATKKAEDEYPIELCKSYKNKVEYIKLYRPRGV